MPQSSMSMISTMWTDIYVFFPKVVLSQTHLEVQETIEINAYFYYAKKHLTSSKLFEETYSIIFTDSTSNPTNLDYLESK